MSWYSEKIREIKNLGPVDYIKIKVNGSFATLRVADETEETIGLLTQWRTIYWDAFPTKFHPTEMRTRSWLKNQVINNNDRLLFMIIIDGKKIGHIGVFHYDEANKSVEIDNVLRGVRGNFPGLMEKVLKAMFKWIFNELKLSKITLRVFSDNYKAINLYERCHMLMTSVIPLERIYTTDGWNWEEKKIERKDEYGERYFSVMEITKDSYLSCEKN